MGLGIRVGVGVSSHSCVKSGEWSRSALQQSWSVEECLNVENIKSWSWSGIEYRLECTRAGVFLLEFPPLTITVYTAIVW